MTFGCSFEPQQAPDHKGYLSFVGPPRAHQRLLHLHGTVFEDLDLELLGRKEADSHRLTDLEGELVLPMEVLPLEG